MRLYTTGLPGDIKAMRRGNFPSPHCLDFTSDLWEQSQDADLSRHVRRGVTWQILARMMFGMPDDLLWRAEQSGANDKRDLMNLTTYLIRPRTYINLAVVLISIRWTANGKTH